MDVFAMVLACLGFLMLVAAIVFAWRLRRFQDPGIDYQAMSDRADAIVTQSGIGFR